MNEFLDVSFLNFSLTAGQSSFCVNEGDTRLQPMCSSPLNGGKARDRLLGEEECKSPFGTYELMIPVDKRLTCSNTGIQTKNCKDLDVSIAGLLMMAL